MRSLTHSSGWFILLACFPFLARSPLIGCSPGPAGAANDWGGEGSGPDRPPLPGPGSGGDGALGEGSGGTGVAGEGSGGADDGLGGGPGVDGSGGLGGDGGPPPDDEPPDECAWGAFDHDDSPGTACVAWTECQPGQWVAAPGTPDLDQSCEVCPAGTFNATVDAQGCIACPEASFSLAGATSCSPHRSCGWTLLEAAPGTPSSDTLCTEGSPYRQFGTSADDRAHGAVVAPGGGVYVVGGTSGVLADGAVGGRDSFLRRYDANGHVVWTRQFGISGDDSAHQVATDGLGNVLVVGLEEDAGTEVAAYLRKFDQAGSTLWQVELSGDEPCLAQSLTVNAAGTSFVAGVTPPSSTAGARDACVARYDAEGGLVWSRSAGSPLDESAGSVALTFDGRLLVAGSTDGEFGGVSAGGQDAFVWSLDQDTAADGWIRQFGSPADDAAVSVAAGMSQAAGNSSIHVVGWTRGDLISENAGEEDIFLRALGTDGQELEGVQWGTAGADVPSSLARGGSRLLVAARTRTDSSSGVDGLVLVFERTLLDYAEIALSSLGDDVPTGITRAVSGQTFVVGSTTGALTGESFGQSDAFVGLFVLPPQ